VVLCSTSQKEKEEFLATKGDLGPAG